MIPVIPIMPTLGVLYYVLLLLIRFLVLLIPGYFIEDQCHIFSTKQLTYLFREFFLCLCKLVFKLKSSTYILWNAVF